VEILKFFSPKKESQRWPESFLPEGLRSLLSQKKSAKVLDEINLGLSNRILFERFSFFNWPLWLEIFSKRKLYSYCINSNSLLLNSSCREWQCFNNYFDGSDNRELAIDRSGMLSSCDEHAWSMEFWIFADGKTYRPQHNLSEISISRDPRKGFIELIWKNTRFTLREKIFGLHEGRNQALVSVNIDSHLKDDIYLISTIRPYNNEKIGGINSIRFDSDSLTAFINEKPIIACEDRPDFIISSCAISGVDLQCSDETFSLEADCSYGLATIGFKYLIPKTKGSYNFKISLIKNFNLAGDSTKINFAHAFKDFTLLSDFKVRHGINLNHSDLNFENLFLQGKQSFLCMHRGNFDVSQLLPFRDLYIISHGLCRSGNCEKAEEFFKYFLKSFSPEKKKVDFEISLKCSFVILTFYELFIHKRDSGFLNEYYSLLKEFVTYVYNISVDIHNPLVVEDFLDEGFVKRPSISFTLITASSLSSFAYLSRCMGIFGDEAKFKNEFMRLASLVNNVLMSHEFLAEDILKDLLSLPRKFSDSVKDIDYNRYLEVLLESDFPLQNRLYGIDMFKSIVLLNQLLMGGKNIDSLFYKLSSLLDDFFVLPEFIDPLTKRGSYGRGNSKVANAMFFSLLRNMLFVDHEDRLVIFPVTLKEWFKTKSKISLENAPSRFGLISFSMEINGSDIRMSFSGEPKYLPPDIVINLPFNATVVSGDDFIFKKQLGNSFYISGWPSIIRFMIK
jgi:hypothetical protein